jgi:hypothetical protein
MSQLGPWWQNKIASQVGLESVPAQARAWGAFSPQTGVESPIGAPKLELLSMKIMEAANRLGITPEQARDMILTGKAYAGKAEGGPIDSFAPGGKVMSAAGKLLGDAQAAYKSKFTPGFVHSSPSNKITAFDPTKASKPKELITPGITFASPMENAKWSSDNFLPVSGPRSAIEGYKTGATMYPLSINMGKHFDATTPEGQEVAANYVRQKFLSGETPDKKEAAKFLMGISDPQYNWKTMESPDFIRHLKDTGHDTFSVNEMGVKNVGVFEPQNIRGKFAKFNPEDAASPDFMKAKGGLV